MADSSPLAGLLDRAEKVFWLAGKLGSSFENEFRSRNGVVEPAAWSRHEATYKAFGDALLNLRDAMLHPPAQFESIAELLLKASRVMEEIHTAREPARRAWGEHAEFFPDLNSLCADGLRAIDQARRSSAVRNDNPFAFARLALQGPVFSLPERFPATTEGHVRFLEFVCHEVHVAVNAKRDQFAKEYSDETVETTVRAVKWAEASDRLDAIESANLATDVLREVVDRELTIYTVEAIFEDLRPAVAALRKAYDHSRSAIEAPTPECPFAQLVALLQRALRRLKAKPDLLRAYDWNHPDALNAANINGAAQQVGLGPIFDVNADGEGANHSSPPSDLGAGSNKIECLIVFHPNGSKYEVRRSKGMLSDLSANPRMEIEACLQAWTFHAEKVREQLVYERSVVVVETVGDVWKAFSEGKRLATTMSSISTTPGSNVACVTCPEARDEAKRLALERIKAAVTLEGGDKGTAMERLIAKLQLESGRDKATIINMSLVEFAALLLKREASATAAQQVDLGTKGTGNATQQPKASGRPKRDYETIQKEKQVFDDWQRAKVAGTAKVEFAKQRGMTQRDLNKLLGRESARRKRHTE